MQSQLNRQLQVFDVLAHRPTRAELAGARADYLIVDAEFRHAGAFHPLREEVAHVLARDLRCQSFEIIDRSALVPILLEESSQQLIELLLTERFTEHAKDHRAFVKHNRLIGRRLIVQSRRSARDRCGLLESQRALLLFALGRIELSIRKRVFAQGKRAPFGEALRNPRVIERLETDRLSPPLIGDFAL